MLAQLDQFLVEIGSVRALSSQVYRGVARSLLALDPIVVAIRTCSWAPKEAGRQHNGYVDLLLQQVQQLNASLSGLEVPQCVAATILEEAVCYMAVQLVDAYANLKKVNDEGRLHMSRDVRVLQAALDHLQRRRLLPPGPLSLEFVDTYIAALHLQPEQVLEWAQSHREYSIKHLTAVVMTAGVGSALLKKKEQQELLFDLQALSSMPSNS